MEKKSERGVKGTKNKRFPPKERALASSFHLPPPLPFWLELCEMSHVEKTLKKLEKQSEMKLRDVKVQRILKVYRKLGKYIAKLM